MSYSPFTADAQTGIQASIDNFRQLEVAEKTRLVGGDSTSATIDTMTWNTSFTGSATVGSGNIDFDVVFQNGLTVVSTGMSSGNITFIYS